MKFSELEPGMVVIFKKVDVQRWKRFHEPLIRNPNYQNAEHYYQTYVKRYEDEPILVKQIKTMATGDIFDGPSYQALVGTIKGKHMTLSEHWFSPDDEEAFEYHIDKKKIEAAELNKQKRFEIQEGLEKRGVPGGPGTGPLKNILDYAGIPRPAKGTGRRVRKTRKSRKTRKARK